MEDKAKYARLLGVEPDAELGDIKRKYSVWRRKFEAQTRADDAAVVRKGEKNLRLLDHAYQVLAAEAVGTSRLRESTREGVPTPLSVEIGSSRAGINISNIEGFQTMNRWDVRRFKVSWPGAKITFYSDRLKIKALIFATEIEYRQIESIRRYFFMPFVFQVCHRAPDVLPTVIINGIGLGGKMKRLNDEHNLGLPIEY